VVAAGGASAASIIFNIAKSLLKQEVV